MLNIRHLHRSFNGKSVLSDLHLTAPMGETILLIGKNGAGKTTLLKSIAGLLTYDGSVTLSGQQVSLGAGFVTYSADHMPADPKLSGQKNILNYRKSVPDWAECFLDDKTMKTKVSRYSHGQKQRLNLIRALASNAPIRLLDEPTTGLDDDGIPALMEHLQDTGPQHITILVSHDVERCKRIANRTLYLDKGKLHDQ